MKVTKEYLREFAKACENANPIKETGWEGRRVFQYGGGKWCVTITVGNCKMNGRYVTFQYIDNNTIEQFRERTTVEECTRVLMLMYKFISDRRDNE